MSSTFGRCRRSVRVRFFGSAGFGVSVPDASGVSGDAPDADELELDELEDDPGAGASGSPGNGNLFDVSVAAAGFSGSPGNGNLFDVSVTAGLAAESGASPGNGNLSGALGAAELGGAVHGFFFVGTQGAVVNAGGGGVYF